MTTRSIVLHDHEGKRHIPFYDPQPIERSGFLGLLDRMLDGAQSVHTADPITRGLSVIGRTTVAALILALFTVPALWMLDSLGWMLWLFCATGEWFFLFVYLSYKDWQEHPNAIRWHLAREFLYMMEREQDARFLQAGLDLARLDQPRPPMGFLHEFSPERTRKPQRSGRAQALAVFVAVLFVAVFALWFLQGV